MYFITNNVICNKSKISERTNRGVLNQCKNAESINIFVCNKIFFSQIRKTIKIIEGGIVYLGGKEYAREIVLVYNWALSTTNKDYI